MSTEDIICVVREHRWLSADEQAKVLGDRGDCRQVLSLGGGKRLRQITRPDLEKLAREGTTVRFVFAFLLAEQRRNVVAMRADFRSALKRLERKGAVLADVESGLTTGTEGHRKAMVALADHMIGRHCQGKRSAKNGAVMRGRQLVEFTTQQLKDAKAIWRDTIEYPTWQSARDALAQIRSAKGEKFTSDRARRLWKARKSKR